MNETFWIITALLAGVIMLILLACIINLDRRLKKVETFIDDAFPILFPLWLERERNKEA